MKINENKLKKMFEIQNNTQQFLGNWDKIKNESDKQQYINQMLLACYEEVTEIMRETAYKNPNIVKFGWKKKQEWNLDNYKDEIIDLFHFLMNLSLVVGMNDEEFFDRYIKKNKKNIERQKNGY